MYVYVCIYIRNDICIVIYTSLYKYICTGIHTHTRTLTYILTCIHSYRHTYIIIHTYIRTYIQVHTWCTRTCEHAHVHT